MFRRFQAPLYRHLYLFFLTSSFPMIGSDRLKYWFGLINIALGWLLSV